MNPLARRAVAALLIAPVLSLAVPAPARAGEAYAHAAIAYRAQVERLLVEHGVDGAEAGARAAALTDEEAARLAAGFHVLPAGAGNDPLQFMLFAVAVYVGVHIVAAAALLILGALVIVAIVKALERRARPASDITRSR